MTWFHFSQNNSGGSFQEPALHILIEARSAEIASCIAETEAGIYFDGVYKGQDCPCCGDRWSTPYGSGEPTPTIYTMSIEKALKDAKKWGWTTNPNILFCLQIFEDGTRKAYPYILSEQTQ